MSEIKDLISNLEKYCYQHACKSRDYQQIKDGFNVLYPYYSTELTDKKSSLYKDMERTSIEFGKTLKTLESEIVKMQEELIIKDELIKNYENNPKNLVFSEDTVTEILTRVLWDTLEFKPAYYQKLQKIVEGICDDYEIKYVTVLNAVVKQCIESDIFDQHD